MLISNLIFYSGTSTNTEPAITPDSEPVVVTDSEPATAVDSEPTVSAGNEPTANTSVEQVSGSGVSSETRTGKQRGRPRGSKNKKTPSAEKTNPRKKVRKEKEKKTYNCLVCGEEEANSRA